MDIHTYIKGIKKERKKRFFESALKDEFHIEILSREHRVSSFTKNKRSFLLINDFTSFNTKATAKITRDKHLTKEILNAYNISVPRGVVAEDMSTVNKAIKSGIITYPLAVKPLDAAKGVAVSLGVANSLELHSAVEKIEQARTKTHLMQSDKFIVEEMVYGNDYRVLVLNNKVIACAQRIPAFVIGDGEETIKDLIRRFNTERPKGYEIDIDQELGEYLSRLNMSLGTVPRSGQKITLRDNANISSGGRAVDCTQQMSQRLKDICLRAAQVIDGIFVGIDLFVEDILTENKQQRYAIIEINGAPDYDIHEEPVIESLGIDITKQLIDYIYESRGFDLQPNPV